MTISKTWAKPELKRLSVDRTLGGFDTNYNENFVDNNGTENDPSDDEVIGANYS